MEQKNRKLKNNKLVLKGDIFVKCQSNTLTEHDMIFLYIGLTILDRATTQLTLICQIIFQLIMPNILIPTRLTSSFQPLDVGINKEIKVFMKQCDSEFRIKNCNIRAPIEEKIIEMFDYI